MTVYEALPLNQVRPDPNQPRKIFDEDALAELAASIREHGVLQPIGVYPNGRGYIISHGERRWLASQLAGLETIPAIIGEKPDELRLRIRQFVENDQREPLNVIETALFYRDMLDSGLSMSELSRQMGRGGQTTYITNALLWLKLEEEAQTAVAAKRLPKDPRVARALLDIPDKEARVKTAVALASRKASIQACVSAAGNVTKKLKEANKPSQVKTPAVALNGKLPKNGRVTWGGARQAAQAMCNACSLKELSNRPEPAWTLVLQAADQVCDDCTAKNGRDLAICRECPGVTLIKKLAEVTA